MLKRFLQLMGHVESKMILPSQGHSSPILLGNGESGQSWLRSFTSEMNRELPGRPFTFLVHDNDREMTCSLSFSSQSSSF
jgi:hypothetical protein